MRTKLRAGITDKEKESNPGNLLELWIEVWPFCHLNCSYCMNAGGNTGNSWDLLNPGEYQDLLWQLKELGGKAIGIPGNGEPLHNRNRDLLFKLAEQAKVDDLRAYVFTAGDLISPEMAAKLFDAGFSLMVKWNSFNSEVQDTLVGTPGYTQRRLQCIGGILRAGFNREDTNHEGDPCTRLGFVTSILEENYDEMPYILRWCRRHNVLPDFDTIAHQGRGAQYVSRHGNLTDQHVRAMFGRLQCIDREEFGNDWGINPTYVDGCCNRHTYHMYVDCWGNISPCMGANKNGIVLGNIRKGYTLEDAWESPLMQKIRVRDYAGKCTECAHFKSASCNSCLGRFTDLVSIDRVETTGCWNFEAS